MTSFTSNSDSGGRTSFRSVSDARLAILVLHPMDIRTTPCPDSWQSFKLREWSSLYGTQISCLLCPPPLLVASFLFTSPRLLPSPTYSFCLFLFPPLSSAVLFPLSCSLFPLSISSYSLPLPLILDPLLPPIPLSFPSLTSSALFIPSLFPFP